MSQNFYKFPSTPHLALLGGVDVRSDKVMSESQQMDFLANEIIVEEKVDGANLGISFDSEGNILTQNRGGYLMRPYAGQWEKLGDWLALKADILFELLLDRLILFGEWCYARHSVFYDRLPDWFVGFDLFDKHTSRFLSWGRRNEMLKRAGIFQTPFIDRGVFTLNELIELLSQSKWGGKPAEGLYFRYDKAGYLIKRAKLVRPAFIQFEEHWLRSGIKPNRLRTEPFA